MHGSSPQSDAKETANGGQAGGTDRPDQPIAARTAVITATIVAAFFALISLSPAHDAIEFGASSPMMFRLREMTGMAPELSPNLRLLAFDDRAASLRGLSSHRLEDWTRVLNALKPYRPKAVLLGSPFTHFNDPAALAAFTSAANATGAVIAARALKSSLGIPGLREISPTTDALSLRDLQLGADAGGGEGGTRQRPPFWLPQKRFAAYGPAAPFLPSIRYLGHGGGSANGTIEALVNVGPGVYLPHWGLLAGGEPPAIRNRRLSVAGHEVGIDDNARMPVNLVAGNSAGARIRSVADLVHHVEVDEPNIQIRPGDTVMIFGDMTAGVLVSESTPIGAIPQAWLDASIANSVLTGHWLSPLPGAPLFQAAASGLAAAIVRRTRGRRQLIAVALVALGWTALALTLFMAAGWILPVSTPVAALLVTYGICGTIASRSIRRKTDLMRHDLAGMLSPAKLQTLLEQAALHRLDATEQIVSIMFLDIVGFSKAAEKQTPREAFDSLKQQVARIRQTIHDHGGVVDRTMGDGMLCVFGFEFDATTPTAGSAARAAAQAVQCALAIQRENIKSILASASGSQNSVFPMRIGINTAGVYIGDLGTGGRMDLTVIGNGVNFAQRLEAACDRHMVMVGAATRDMLHGTEAGQHARKRHIKVKHMEELVEAYEIDPFYDNPRLLNDGEEAYRVFIGVERVDVRWPVPYPGLITISTNFGGGDLVNFSTDGFTVKLSEYYAKDVTIHLVFNTEDGWLADRLRQAGLAPLILEVRWARPAGTHYVHGCLLKNLSREQRDLLIDLLRQAIQMHGSLRQSA